MGASSSLCAPLGQASGDAVVRPRLRTAVTKTKVLRVAQATLAAAELEATESKFVAGKLSRLTSPLGVAPSVTGGVARPAKPIRVARTSTSTDGHVRVAASGRGKVARPTAASDDDEGQTPRPTSGADVLEARRTRLPLEVRLAVARATDRPQELTRLRIRAPTTVLHLDGKATLTFLQLHVVALITTGHVSAMAK